MKTLSQLTLLLLFSATSNADINIKDGSFVKTWQDTSFLQRTYRSRSLNSGFFGYGWCSNLEKYLLPRANGDLVFKDCSLDTDMLLTRTKEGSWSYRGLIQVTQKSPGVFLLSQNKKLWTFNSIGKLLGDGRFRYVYKNGLIVEIHSQKDQRWKLTWDQDQRRILSIQGKANFNYSYENDNLVKAETDEVSLFTYDSFHNLSKIQMGLEKRTETISYNSHRDLVTSHRDSNSDCVEIFEYRSENALRSQTLLKKQCGKQATKTTKYDFFYRKLPLGIHILSQMKVSSAEGAKTYQFHAITGLAQEIKTKFRIGENHE